MSRLLRDSEKSGPAGQLARRDLLGGSGGLLSAGELPAGPEAAVRLPGQAAQ